MSSSASSDSGASTARVNQPTLLGIPAELRNKVYDNVFSSETKHGLAPHALTRVNRCIRRESLAMYYASAPFTTLVIPLHSPTQFAHAKEWLAEVDTNLYPVLPDIEFLWTESRTYGNRNFGLRCARRVTTLSEVLNKQVQLCVETGVQSSDIIDKVMQRTYDYCLGYSELDFRATLVPLDFKRVVRGALAEESRDRTWIVRHLSLLPGCRQNPCTFMFTDLAIRKNGYEWEMPDLRYIVESLEDVVVRLSQRHQ